MEKENNKKTYFASKNTTIIRSIVQVALFAALLSVSAWISIPSVIPFTLQTFVIFLVISLLGSTKGLFSIILYLAIGMCGLPVFSNFKGGISALLGPTGGYMIGWIFIALTALIFEKIFGKKTHVYAISLVLGLIICYLFGSLWFMFGYSQNANEELTFYSVLLTCVFPFIGVDLIKLCVALTLRKMLVRFIKLNIY